MNKYIIFFFLKYELLNINEGNIIYDQLKRYIDISSKEISQFFDTCQSDGEA